jgi:hypothetical protein
MGGEMTIIANTDQTPQRLSGGGFIESPPFVYLSGLGLVANLTCPIGPTAGQLA